MTKQNPKVQLEKSEALLEEYRTEITNHESDMFRMVDLKREVERKLNEVQAKLERAEILALEQRNTVKALTTVINRRL